MSLRSSLMLVLLCRLATKPTIITNNVSYTQMNSTSITKNNEVKKHTETRPRPLKEDCSRRVSFESRNGTCVGFPSLSFPITVPKVNKLLLMYEPSFLLTPVVSVLELSDPAKSIKFCHIILSVHHKKYT